MKLKIIYIVATWYLLLLAGSSAIGQDLIKDTQLGNTTSPHTHTPNLIAQQVEVLKATKSFSPVSLLEVSSQDRQAEYSNYVEDAVYLELNTKELTKLFENRRDYITLSIPVSATQSFEVELMEVNIFSDDFQVEVSDGSSIDASQISGIFYQGIIKDSPGSLVAFSFFDNHIRGLMSDHNGNYVLGQTEDQPDTYVLYNDRELKVQNNFSCGVEENMKPPRQGKKGDNEEKSVDDCIDVYVEADYATYQSHGSSTANVANFVAALFNEVKTLYTNESLGVNLSQLFVWASADPYASSNNTSDALSAFRLYRTSFNGDLAHLISTRSLGGGIAYLDVLCNSAYSYAVSANLGTTVTPLPTFSWEVMVFAHEMGHNFGSRHTQWCGWTGGPIDNCVTQEDDNFNQCSSCCNPGPTPSNGGTIMSYCHVTSFGINLNLGFGPQPGNLIRSRFNSASCKSACPGGCPTNITVTTTYNSGNNIDLEASNNITGVNIVNSGANVDYDAGNAVTLSPGFHARDGSDFHAFIDGCGGALIANDTNEIPDGTSSALATNTPDLDELAQLGLRNFPNPFTGQTSIEYVLPEDSPVTLIVSDLTGKQIAALVNNEQRTKGMHVVLFDGSNYPAGMYYYTIQVGKYLKTEKMTLMK